jgi:hypothetical protein
MALQDLHHQSPELVTWQYEELQFALLGGIRIEGLHSMRVTLKVDFKNIPSIRHSLDLYNETQTDKLIKKIAERFNLSTTYIHTAVGHLINTVEAYRLRELDHQQKNTHTKPVLTKEAVEEATNFLKTNNLLLTTNDLIGKSGVIGEELNRLIMFLVFTSRKMQRPLHIISFGSSGSGKSHLQEKVSELIPG